MQTLIGQSELMLHHAERQVALAKIMRRLNEKLGHLGLPPEESGPLNDFLARSKSFHESFEAEIKTLRAKLQTYANITKLKGVLTGGLGKARNCIEQQKPLLKNYVPEIASMFGTINVLLDSPLLITKYDVETPPLQWSQNCTERFRLVNGLFQLITPGFGEPVPCLLYFAETSPYRSNPFFVEVVTKQLKKGDAKECLIFYHVQAARFRGLLSDNGGVWSCWASWSIIVAVVFGRA